MDNVRQTVLTSLQQAGYGSYASYAEPVITALEGRERDISGVLIQYATAQGMSRQNVEGALQQAGMQVPQAQTVAATPPQTQREPAAGGTGDPVLDALLQIQNDLAGLTQFARDNGYNG